MKRSVIYSLLAATILCAACDDRQDAEEDFALTNAPTQLQSTPDYNGENAYIHCAALCKLGSRPSGSAAYKKQLDYLSRYLLEYGWTVTQQEFTAPNGTPMFNLHAVYGDFDAARPIIVSCHIDTKTGISDDFQGADDGASGAAVMIELARILAAKPEDAGQIELVFFDGEESFAPRMTETDGLYGSKHDVARRGNQLPLYQINLDMVGARNKIIKVPMFDTDPELAEYFDASVQELKLNEKKWQIADVAYMDDDQPFREAGVATINIIADFVNSIWWHTPRDNMSRICPTSLKESGMLTHAMLRRILSARHVQH